MDSKQGTMTCALGCWLVAALGGVLAAALLMLLGGWSVMQAVFVGAVIFGVAGLLLSLLLCKPLPQAGSVDPQDTPLARAQAAHAAPAATADAAPAASAPASAPAAQPAAASASVSMAEPLVKPSAELKGTQELAARKGTYKYVKPAAADAAPKPARKKAAPKKSAAKAAEPKAKDAAPEKAASTKAASEKTTAAKAKAASPKRAPVAADGQPEVLSKARAGGADDLKMIKGVGPGLEKTLNELGFYHFDQIAGWRKKEIEWVDSRLKFKGRIERDEWTKQAKALAKGG